MLTYHLFDNGDLIRNRRKHDRLLYSVRVRAIAKDELKEAPYEFGNEFICQELCRIVGLPICRNEDATRDDNRCRIGFWSSFLAPEQLPPEVDARAVAQADMKRASGILLFDLWVRNMDRHTRNLAFNEDTKEVVLFDHGECPFRAVDPLLDFKDNVDSFSVANHCLLEEITTFEHFPYWSNRIASVPANMIREILRESTSYGIPTEWIETGLWFLVRRQARLNQLIDDNRWRFSGIGLGPGGQRFLQLGGDNGNN